MLRIVFLCLVSSTVALGGTVGLKIRVVAEKSTYQPGDTLEIAAVYTNTSPTPIRLLSDPVLYPARAFRFENASTRAVGIFRKYAHVGIDMDQWAKETVVVRPGESYRRAIRAEIASFLPPEYHDQHKGLFVVFPLSAIELPGPGLYKMTVEYDSREHPVRRFFVGKAPPLWQGKISSSPVLIQIKTP
jgi:hypothetical protein